MEYAPRPYYKEQQAEAKHPGDLPYIDHKATLLAKRRPAKQIALKQQPIGHEVVGKLVEAQKQVLAKLVERQRVDSRQKVLQKVFPSKAQKLRPKEDVAPKATPVARPAV